MTTVKLDPGDSGLEFIPGVGFRPIDGIQVYGGGKIDCPIIRTWKNTATDRVHADRECQQPNAPPVFAEVYIPPVPTAYAGISTYAGYHAQTPYWPTGGGYVPHGIPYYPVIIPPPEGPCCIGITVVPPPAPPPEIPPVPIIGSSVALLTALLALVCVRVFRNNSIAARVMQWMLDGYRPPEWPQ